MKEKLRSAIYGFAVGDALGVPFEFRTRDTFKCTDMIRGGVHNQPVGTWSDDTSMVLATMSSLSKSDGLLNPNDLMDQFILWRDLGKYTPWGNCFDIGNTTLRAIMKSRHDANWEDWGGTSEFDNGNGSLMRILPFAFLAYDEHSINVASAITHNTTRCKFACEMYVKICQALITDEFDFFDPYMCMINNMDRVQVKSTGYVLDSFIAALWCFLHSDNYAQAVITAVNLGDDTDTIAALTGALAGLYYGFDDIPGPWIEKLATKNVIEEQLDNFGKIIVA